MVNIPEPHPISIMFFVFDFFKYFILFNIWIIPSVVGWWPVPKPVLAGIIMFLLIKKLLLFLFSEM